MNDSGQRDLREVIEAAKAGDQEAFSYIYELYFKPVYRYLYFRTGSPDDSQELAQEVFLKAYKSFGRYTYSTHDPLAYFYTIARNTLIDRGRKLLDTSLGEPRASNLADEAARARGRAFQRSAFSGRPMDRTVYDSHIDFVVTDKVLKREIQFNALHLQA